MELVVGDFEHIRRNTDYINEEYIQYSVSEKSLNTKITSKTFNGHLSSVNYCQFTNEDKLVFSCSDDKTAKLWNSSTNKCVETFLEPTTKGMRCGHVNPNDMEFVTGGNDKKVRLWNIEKKKQIWNGEHRGIIMACRISHDGELLASGSDLDNQIRIWDRRAPNVFNKMQDLSRKTPTSLKFTQENDKLISTSFDGSVTVYDLRTNKTTLTLLAHKNIVSCCSLTLNDHFLATGGWDRIVYIWDISTGKYRTAGPTPLDGHEGSVSCCAFDSEGRWLVTGGYDNLIILWDMNENSVQLQLADHNNWIQSVDIAKSQEAVLSCSRDHTVRLWDIRDTIFKAAGQLGDEFISKILQCNQCGKIYISNGDFQDIEMCKFCKLDSRNQETL